MDFLVEIGTEELPPKSLALLGETFAAELHRALVDADLLAADARAADAFWSPRRLAARLAGVRERQPDCEELRKGPALAAAYDKSGKPTRAAEGFARSAGVPVAALERLETDDGAWVVCRRRTDGRAAAELLPALVQTALSRLPIARRMRWGAGDDAFVRPVHWVVMLLDADVVDGAVLGVRAGRETRGHRFHSTAPIALRDALDYPARVEAEGRVRVNAPDRRLDAAIRLLVSQAAERAGGHAQPDGALVAEVAALVEWPVAIDGSFDDRYLELPSEVLVSVLEAHQRCFPVRDASGALLPQFIAVANIESRDPAVVRRGNERVIRPRLADAAFFFAADRKHPLASRRDALAQVTFQAKAGSLADKSARVAALAAHIASQVGADPAVARRAAELAKCDLVTLMVGEFPELQGTMGGHYAARDGEPAPVAAAIAEQYLPRFAGDALPATPAGRALGLADRFDTLAAVFATAGRPTGDKDPYALRRTALGALRIMIDAGLDVDAAELAAAAVAGLPPPLRTNALADELVSFALERLRAGLLDSGTPPDTFDAVSAVRPTRPADFVARVRAVDAFRALPDADALAAANKRIANILRQASVPAYAAVDDTRLVERAEQELWGAVTRQAHACRPLLAAARYEDALRELAALRAPVDAFFDGVMVMADDPALRENRIALIAQVADLFGQVADIGRLQPRSGT